MAIEIAWRALTFARAAYIDAKRHQPLNGTTRLRIPSIEANPGRG